MDRGLDGMYCRVQRESGWENVCFSDLSPEERMNIMKDKDKEWLIAVCEILASTIKNIGDQLDITCE